MTKGAASLLLGALLLTTGCVGYRVTPDKPASMPRADTRTGLKVGVSLKNEFEWKGFGISNKAMDRWRSWNRFKPVFAQADGIGEKFVKALDDSGAFGSVAIMPGRSFGAPEFETHDLVIDARFKGVYQQDPGTFGKAFVTGFLLLLPAPFVRYEDGFAASAELSIYDSAGRLVRRLADKQDATTSAALFSAGQPSQITAGIESSASNLAAKLVAAIIGERALLQPGAARPAAKLTAAPAAAPAVAAAAPTATPAPPAPVALAEGPSRVELPTRAANVRVTDEEAAAELLP